MAGLGCQKEGKRQTTGLTGARVNYTDSGQEAQATGQKFRSIVPCERIKIQASLTGPLVPYSYSC